MSDEPGGTHNGMPWLITGIIVFLLLALNKCQEDRGFSYGLDACEHHINYCN